MKTDDLVVARRQYIGRYIRLKNVGTPKEELFIYIGDLLSFLMAHREMHFSATLFETHLQKELNAKVVGRPITPDVFNSICDYIWQLGLYCTSVRAENFAKTTEMVKQRALAARDRAKK
jgi:hypothetical protein